MGTTGTRWAARAVAALGVAAAVGTGLGVAPAGAEQKGTSAPAQQACRQLGGTWSDGMYDGIEGKRCRINLFYGCGVEVNYGPDGKPLGGNAWCFDRYVDW